MTSGGTGRTYEERHSKLRLARSICTGSLAVLLAFYVGSIHSEFFVASRARLGSCLWYCSFGAGCLKFVRLGNVQFVRPSSWGWRAAEPVSMWVPHCRYIGRSIYLSLPMWVPVAVLFVSSVALWLKKLSCTASDCHNCGYNLTGNLSGRCPECGCTTSRREDQTELGQ